MRLWFSRLAGLILLTLGCLMASAVGPFIWQNPSPNQIVGLLVIACTGVFGHMILMKAYEIAPASVLQPFSYTQLVWGIFIGIMVFGEYPDGLMLLGAGIVVIAGIIAMRAR